MSFGSVLSAAAPVIGGGLSKIGSSGRQRAAQRAASRSLVLNQSSPLSESRFNPATQSLSFSLTPQANQALSNLPPLLNPRVEIPRPREALINSSLDEIRKNFSGTSERVRDSLADTARDVTSTITNFRGELNTSLAQSSALFGKLQEGEALTRDELGGLLSRVRPGFGELSAAVEATIESERQRSVSDLRGNLAQRRVLGSSFAESTVASTNAEFAQRKRVARAESFLAELDLSRQILQQQFTNQFETVQLGLQRINDAIAAKLTQFQTELQGRLQLGELETSSLLSLGQLGLDSERARIAAELERAGLDQSAAIAEAEQEVERTLANLGITEEEFNRLLEVGKLTNDIASGLQSSFSANSRLQQDLLAEGARGRGGAFTSAIGGLGDILDDVDFGGGLSGGGGSDFFNLTPTTLPGGSFTSFGTTGGFPIGPF